MTRIDYPFRPADVKFGNNMIVNLIILCFVIAIILIGVIVWIIGFVFIKGSGIFVSRYNSLKSFYPLFCRIVITTALLQFISLVLYVCVHKTLWIYYLVCFICVLLGCILTAATNRIRHSNEKVIKKKMYIYCWCFNTLLFVLNILPYIYYNVEDVVMIENIFYGWDFILIALVILHIALFVLGRFYDILLEKYQ